METLNWEIHYYFYFVGFCFKHLPQTCRLTVSEVGQFRGMGKGGRSGNDEGGDTRGAGGISGREIKM